MYAEDIIKNFLIGKEIDVFYTFSKVSVYILLVCKQTQPYY